MRRPGTKRSQAADRVPRSERGGWLRLLPALLAAGGLAGCATRVQSMLHPAAEPAARINGLWWLLFITTGIIFVAVVILLLIAVFRRPREDNPAPPLGATRFVVFSGIVMPVGVLTGILFATLNTTVALREPKEGLLVRVVGHQYWWEVHYPGQNITIANELRIPAGQPVRLELRAADVIHSFWVPRLNGKMDLLPEKTNTFWIAADRPGRYRGQCAEFCGLQHAKMAFWVVALPPEEFQAWAAAASRPSPPPATPLQRRGLDAFFRTGCHECHAVAGTRATATLGPSLTRLGERLTLGAGTLPNNTGNLQGWIANPQAIKPGNLMPRMYVPSEDLHAIAAYLESLR